MGTTKKSDRAAVQTTKYFIPINFPDEFHFLLQIQNITGSTLVCSLTQSHENVVYRVRPAQQ